MSDRTTISTTKHTKQKLQLVQDAMSETMKKHVTADMAIDALCDDFNGIDAGIVIAEKIDFIMKKRLNPAIERLRSACEEFGCVDQIEVDEEEF